MQICPTIHIEPNVRDCGLPRNCSWSLVKKVSATRRAERARVEAYLWQYIDIERFERNEVDGPFSAGSLGNGIGSTGQAQEIPDHQEQDTGKLRKRRRDMEEPAT